MTTSPKEFDVIVIGTGSGSSIADSAIAEGLTAAIVDKGPFGGTCVQRGCIPSKELIHSADVMETIKTAEKFGIKARVESIDWDYIIRRVANETEESGRVIEERTRNNGIAIYKGEARFVDHKVLEVNGERITAPTIMVSAGSRPAIPPIPGIADVPYITSDEALFLPEQPRRLIVLGGGFIGAELAHFFGALGTEVTIIDMAPLLVSTEDHQIAERFTDVFRRKYNVVLDARVSRVYRQGDGIGLDVTTPDGDRTFEGDTLLVATGRTPNTDLLDVAATGVEVDSRGFVAVDEYLETSVPGIWALGDIVGKFMLKHNANWEWWYADHNMFNRGPKKAVDYHAMPRAVFSSPQIGSVGLTEEQLQEQGIPYVVGSWEYIWGAYGIAIDDRDGLVKVLAHPETREILGCHIIGTDASMLIQEVANAMRLHLTTDVFSQGIYIHPALPEVIYRAFRSVPGTKVPPV